MAKLLLLAGLVAFSCIVQAARLPSDTMAMFDSLPQSVLGFQSGKQANSHASEDTSAAAGVVGSMMSSAAYSDLEVMLATNEEINNNKGTGKWTIHVVTKFLVKPDLHANFVHRWWSYNARTEEEKGILHHSLSKVAGDNIVWSSYIVYDGVAAAFKHLRSEALQDFGAFLVDSNIPVEYHLVVPIHGCHRNSNSDCFERDDAAGAGLAAPFAAGTGEDNKKRRSWPVRLVTKYIVPPRDAREFIEEWGRLADGLDDVKGKLALVLNKPADDNTVFVSYSAWESYEALGKAAHKKATREFLEFLTDKDIVAVTKKLWRLPSRHP